MRHRIAGNKLSRNQSLRKATLRDMAKATLVHQRIRTTKAKAKEARKLVDRLITLGKKGTLAGRRKAFSILCDHRLVRDLFLNISPRFQNRMGGYTRIIPLASTRRGDNASLVFLELTEKVEVLPTPTPAAKEKAAAAEKKVQPEKKAPKQEEKKPEVKPERPKPPLKEGKSKPSPKFGGGIKNIFRKKSDKKGS